MQWRKMVLRRRWGEKRMLVKVKGKEQSIKDLEEVINLLEEAKRILYRIPTQIEIEVKEHDTELSSIDSQDTQSYSITHRRFVVLLSREDTLCRCLHQNH